jgi:hypothetical protein
LSFGEGCLGAKSQHIVQALLSSQRKNYFVLNHFVEKIRTHPRFKASHKRHNQRNLLQGTKVLPDPAYGKRLHRLLKIGEDLSNLWFSFCLWRNYPSASALAASRIFDARCEGTCS